MRNVKAARKNQDDQEHQKDPDVQENPAEQKSRKNPDVQKYPKDQKDSVIRIAQEYLKDQKNSEVREELKGQMSQEDSEIRLELTHRKQQDSVIRGDSEVQQDQEMIYLTYRDKVMSYIHSRIRSQQEAEDLCSEVFLKIVRKYDSFDRTKASVSTWVYSITKNTVIDYYRKNHMDVPLPEEMLSPDAVDDRLLSEEMLSELTAALALLTEEERRIVIAHYYQNKTLRDISAQMNLSYGIVKLRHRSALKILKKRLLP